VSELRKLLASYFMVASGLAETVFEFMTDGVGATFSALLPTADLNGIDPIELIVDTDITILI
jgi:hypothetical protein